MYVNMHLDLYPYMNMLSSLHNALYSNIFLTQAAADAASLRLSTWLSKQKMIEEKRIRLSILNAKKRNSVPPRPRDLFLSEMNKYVTSDLSGSSNATNESNKGHFELGSFSSR